MSAISTCCFLYNYYSFTVVNGPTGRIERAAYLGLIGVLLRSRLDVGVIVPGPVPQLLLLHDHRVCTDAVQEVLRVRDDDDDLRVRRQVGLKPHARFEV